MTEENKDITNLNGEIEKILERSTARIKETQDFYDDLPMEELLEEAKLLTDTVEIIKSLNAENQSLKAENQRLREGLERLLTITKDYSNQFPYAELDGDEVVYLEIEKLLAIKSEGN